MKCLVAMTAFAGALAPLSGAAAQTSSSGTVSITVVVPPLAAAIAASESGAAGLWTLSEGSETFMIRMPSEFTEGTATELSFYHVPGLVMTVTPMSDGPLVLKQGDAVDLNGLRRETFAVNLSEASSRVSIGQSTAFVVATI